MGMADKLMAAGIVLAVLAGLGWLFNHQINARIVAEDRATKYELAAELAEAKAARLETSLEEETRRAAILADELQLARVQESEAIQVLEDRSRLARLTNAKPGLIEIRARKATTAVWTTIEAEANAPL